MEEPYEEEPEQKEVIEEIEVEEQIAEQEELSSEISELHPPPETTKKVKVGGFFGKEIEIKLKKEATSQTEVPVAIKEPEEPISITSLSPPRKKTTRTIKLCRICGTTLQNATICPTCGAKLD